MTSRTDGRSYEELARQVVELREENARLRGLLGLDHRAAGGHETAWAPTLLAMPSTHVSIDRTATAAEKLALLWSLFGTRSDVYATRWENASTGKAGWSPATRGGWSAQRSAKDYLPLTDEVFVGHLRGGLTAGIYSSPVTPARWSRVTSTRAPGRSTRSPISMPATPTASPQCWRGRGRATARTCGCSSMGQCQRRRRGPWAQRCSAKR